MPITRDGNPASGIAGAANVGRAPGSGKSCDGARGWNGNSATSHMPEVLANPEHVGFRPASDPRRVEFVRSVGSDRRLLLVSVKFLDAEDEAWVSSAHPLKERYLTRRLRAGTMQPVSRGP